MSDQSIGRPFQIVRSKTPVLLGNVGLLVSAVFLVLISTLLIDRAIGALSRETHSLVFPRLAVVEYSTKEFRETARINNLGFRGEDFAIGKRKRYRIAVLGDSFTFGWGVADRDTWPKALEEELQKRGLDLEVANLGRPGTHPADFAEIAERAIPVLKPDLVVVAINHGDDLSQIMGAQQAHTAWKGLKSGIKGAIKALYPNVPTLLAPREARLSATAGWKGDVSRLLAGLGPGDRQRFDRMDGEIRAMFVEGELNPGLLHSVLFDPSFIEKTLDLRNPAVQDGIGIIAKHLAAIKARAGEFGGDVVAISLPNGFFVSPSMLESYARMGFIVRQDYLTTTAMDQALDSAASKAGVGFSAVTGGFREAAARRTLFYRFDGHYNRDGQRLFAESIGPFIASRLSALPRK
jgi:lysophospholipase L1-like esterase